MRKKDIKRIFDICNRGNKDGNKMDVNSENVKAAVMEKIGMSAAEGFYTVDEGEEAVEPVFVTAPKKNKGVTAIKIAAVGAAACLGVGILCVGMFGKSGILSALPQSNAENNKNVPTETTEFTTVSDGQNVDTEIAGEDIRMQLVLLDGIHFTYEPVDNYKENYVFDRNGIITPNKRIRFLYEENGRLYIVKTKDGKKTTEDITDKISLDDFYLYAYNNPDNIVNQTHYVIIGGDVSTGDYGYMEIFKVKNSVNGWGWDGNFSKISPDFHSHNDLYDSGIKWIDDGIRELAENYGVAADMIGSGVGNCEDNVDFNTTMQITLLDGSRAKMNYKDDSITFDKTADTTRLYEENGRLYFVNATGDKEDITDKISENDFYLYIYENPENAVNSLHYIVVGGDVSSGNYGYCEVFQVDTDSWCWSCKYSKDITYQRWETLQWFNNAIKALEEKYDVLFGVGCYTSEPYENAAEANEEKTIAEFLSTEDGLSLQMVANKAAMAYLRSDKEELSRYLADPNYNALDENSRNIFDQHENIVLKPVDSTSIIESDGVYSMVYQILIYDNEMIIYLDLGLRKTDNGWKVEYIYLQG